MMLGKKKKKKEKGIDFLPKTIQQLQQQENAMRRRLTVLEKEVGIYDIR